MLLSDILVRLLNYVNPAATNKEV